MSQETVNEKMARMRAARKDENNKPIPEDEYRSVSDEEFHDSRDKLAEAYLEYFDAYFIYLEKDSYRTYFKFQKKLRHLIDMAKLVQLDCQDNFYNERLRPGIRKQRKRNAQQK